jgi:mono/diheme cytochrome c family protein
MREGIDPPVRPNLSPFALALFVGSLVTFGCGPEPAERDAVSLAAFDSILAELGGPATAALDRGQRWRMIASTGGGLPPTDFEPSLLPEQGSPGARLVQFYCVQCHGLPVPHMHTAEEWPAVLRRMWLRAETLSRHMGGRVTERLLGEMRMAGMAATNLPSREERDTLLAYLRRHSFPGIDPASLPDLPGRSLYIEHCGLCHRTADPAAHPPGAWEMVVARMQGNMRAMDVAPPSEEERGQIVEYLRAAAEAR